MAKACYGGHGRAVLWQPSWRRAVAAMAEACWTEVCCGGHGKGMLWRPWQRCAVAPMVKAHCGAMAE